MLARDRWPAALAVVAAACASSSGGIAVFGPFTDSGDYVIGVELPER